MGVINQQEWANRILAERLHFRIEDGGSSFWSLLDRVGKKRFEHCVELVTLWQRPMTTGIKKYDKLVQLMWMVTPDKVGKYRNAGVQHAREVENVLDGVLADCLFLDDK